MNPSLRQMRALVAIAKTGSFTLAAEYLHVTQSALSGQIKELEQMLGVTVVERTTRKAQLSELGRELYPLFDKMLQDLEQQRLEVTQKRLERDNAAGEPEGNRTTGAAVARESQILEKHGRAHR